MWHRVKAVISFLDLVFIREKICTKSSSKLDFSWKIYVLIFFHDIPTEGCETLGSHSQTDTLLQPDTTTAWHTIIWHVSLYMYMVYDRNLWFRSVLCNWTQEASGSTGLRKAIRAIALPPHSSWLTQEEPCLSCLLENSMSGYPLLTETNWTCKEKPHWDLHDLEQQTAQSNESPSAAKKVLLHSLLEKAMLHPPGNFRLLEVFFGELDICHLAPG